MRIKREPFAVLAVICLTMGAHSQPGPGVGGGLGGPEDSFLRAQPLEQATPEQIGALVAKLGPGLYHRMSGCEPPPRWGTGSPADDAAAHLVKIGPLAVSAVLPLADCREEGKRALVIEILSRIRDNRALPLLINAVQHDKSDRVRVSAAEGLGWSTDPAAAAALVPALSDTDRQVQMFAVKALAKHPQVNAVEPLSLLMYHAAENRSGIAPGISPASVAESAAVALGEIGSPAFERIMELLISSDSEVNRVAGIALVRCDDRRATPALRRLCGSANDTVRFGAIQALGRWSDPESITLLAQLIKIENRTVSELALQSLARMGGSDLDPVLSAAIGDNSVLREAASDAFFYINDRSVSGRLLALVHSGGDHVRQRALFRLGTWEDPRVLPILIRNAYQEDMEPRRLALGLLGRYDDRKYPEIVRPILAAMTASHEWVRNQAAGALIGKRDRRIGPAMKRLLTSDLPGLPALARLVLKSKPH